jgi:hypothetical protein
MANTYTLISSNVLSSSAASVTFSAIPATYTDLVLLCTMRGTGSGGNTIYLEFINSLQTSIYSYTRITGVGTTAASSRISNDIVAMQAIVPGSTYTSNTFGSFEIYFPNYAGASNKVISTFGATEDNATSTNELSAQAGLFRNTGAITTFKISNSGGVMRSMDSLHVLPMSKT